MFALWVGKIKHSGEVVGTADNEPLVGYLFKTSPEKASESNILLDIAEPSFYQRHAIAIYSLALLRTYFCFIVA